MAVTILKPNCKKFPGSSLWWFSFLHDSKLKIFEYWTIFLFVDKTKICRLIKKMINRFSDNSNNRAAQTLHTLLSKAAYIFCPTYTGGARDQTTTDPTTWATDSLFEISQTSFISIQGSQLLNTKCVCTQVKSPRVLPKQGAHFTAYEAATGICL